MDKIEEKLDKLEEKNDKEEEKLDKLEEKADGWWLQMNIDAKNYVKQNRKIITTNTLGEAMISKAIYENPDETPYIIDIDYYGENKRKKKPSSRG